MQTVQSVFAAASLPSGEVPEFKMVLAYEDFANGRCALKFFERIVEEFGKLFTFVPRFLKFEELLSPHVGERVGREVAQADMVVIAAYEEADLPLLVKDWLRSWAYRKRTNETALVALLSGGQERTAGATPVQSHLRQVARRTGMKFLCKQIDWPKQEVAFPVEITRRPDPEEPWILAGPPFPSAGGRIGESLRRQGLIGTTRQEATLCPGEACSGQAPPPRVD